MRRYLTKFDAVMRDALAREFGVDPKVLWDALDGRGGPPRFVQALVASVHPTVTEEDFHQPFDDGLPSVSKGATTDTVTQAQIDTPTKIRGPLPDDHPFTNALRAKGMSVAEWARRHGLKDSKVKSWLRTVDPRKIPKKTAIEIRGELKIPLSAWKQGVRE